MPENDPVIWVNVNSSTQFFSFYMKYYFKKPMASNE